MLLARSAACAAWVAVGLVGLASAPANADDPARDGAATCNEDLIDVVFDNDATHDTDRYYSTGIRVAWGRALFPGGWLIGRVGQELYTPRYLSLLGPLPGDRPYAGWLYAQGEFQVRQASSLHGVAGLVGLIGPEAGGEALQLWVHRVVGVPRPKGWDTQLSIGPTFQLAWESGGHFSTQLARGWRLAAGGLVGAEAGNVRVRGSAGVGLLFGFGVDPADVPALLSEWLAPMREGDGWGFSLFLGGLARTVPYDVFLDDSQGVERIAYQGELRVGFVVSYRRFRFRYVHVIASPEFRAQPDVHARGSFRVSVAY